MENESLNKLKISDYNEGDETNFTIIEPYDKTEENVICIELINNNKLYINYEDDWTIENLIKKIISHKEYERIYTNYRWKIDAYDLNSLFDLHLILFRNIKDDLETKVDPKLKLTDLKKMKILKSSKSPFFIFKDNRNKGFLSFNKNDYEEILGEYFEDNFLNLYKLYKGYLPRTNTINLLRYSIVEDIFEEKQNRVNSLNTLNLDDLISDREDWFTYDDESLNFLMKNEVYNYEVDINNNIYFSDDNKLYFQDKLPYTVLSSKEYKKFLIRIVLKDFETVLSVNLKTTAFQILVKINEKLTNLKQKDEIFNPMEKVLKVRSMNDYILDLSEEIGTFNYITQCIKNCDTPEYIILDYPAKSSANEVIDANEKPRMSSSSSNIDLPKIKHDHSKKSMFNEVSIVNSDSFIDTPVIHTKNKSNYRKHILVNKQNVNKIFNIAKHIPANEDTFKRNLAYHLSNTIKFKKFSSTTPRPPINLKILTRENSISVFEELSNSFDNNLIDSIKAINEMMKENIEEEEEDGTILFKKWFYLVPN